MGYPCGIATRSLPVSNDGHRTCCPSLPLSDGISDSTAAQNSSEITPIRVIGQSSLINAFPFGRHALVLQL